MNVTIEHIGIYAKDLESSREYYEKYFGAVSNSRYENPRGFSSYFLTFESGARLEIMHHISLENRTCKEMESGLSHVAFSVGSREAVCELTERIAADGYEIFKPVRETGDGYFESCVSDPDGNRVEITV
jgi:lactoylglutathione lyase